MTTGWGYDSSDSWRRDTNQAPPGLPYRGADGQWYASQQEADSASAAVANGQRYSPAAYTDPITGQSRGTSDIANYGESNYSTGKHGQNYDPGRYGLSHALSDPNSAVSSWSYYGGSPGAAAQEYQDEKTGAIGFTKRAGERANFDDPYGRGSRANGGIGANFLFTPQGRQAQLVADLQRAAAGDANSIAQQQLRSGYETTNAATMGRVASTRGGGLASALASRSANQSIAAGAMNRANASEALMARERMDAQNRLASLTSQMRDQGWREAQSAASLEEEKRQQNLGMAGAALGRGMGAAGAGLSGTIHWGGRRTDALGSTSGVATEEAARAQERAERNRGMWLGAGAGLLQGTAGVFNKPRPEAK